MAHNVIRVYTIGGRRLVVLPHDTDADVRDEAVCLAREAGVDRVLVIDRAPDGDETVIESIALPLDDDAGDHAADGAGPAVAEAQRIARDAASGRGEAPATRGRSGALRPRRSRSCRPGRCGPSDAA